MKKTRILVALLIALVMVFTVVLAACNDPEVDDRTVLRIAAGYQKTNEAISFQDSDIVGSGLTLADGKTYHQGDLKPTWAQISDWLDIRFEDKFTGAGSAQKEFEYWDGGNMLDQVDIVAGSASVLQTAGAEGKVLDLSQYLDQMPNFKAYLDANPIVSLSITGSVVGDTAGAIYFSPYFDGVDDIERYPLVRSDMVKLLLDGEDAFEGDDRAVNTSAYTPYTPTSGSITVESLNAAGTAKQNITKNYDETENIIAQMNAAGSLTGDEAVAMLRAYIDDMYGTIYENRSDLFLGYDAAWDADELVALLRCAVASFSYLNANRKSVPIVGLYSRETENNQREVDLFRFAGSLFGVRGMESRQDYLYFDKDGNLHDARQEAATYEALTKMNQMFKEGLIAMEGSVNSQQRLAADSGLMSYDYCQTQTVYNATDLQDGEEYLPIMVPVALWNDGSNQDGTWMRFTESWRSVKTDGWALSKAGIGNDTEKLAAALKLIDFAFSIQGQITMSYGSDDFIKVKDASVVIEDWDDVEDKYETFDFNGQLWPVVTDAMYAELQTLTGGNYTNYARRYLGSTLNGFPKSQAFEYQCTNEIGKIGAEKVSAAIALGTIKHPLLEIADNMWYTSIPTTLPTTKVENDQIASYTNLGSTKWNTSSGSNVNTFLNVIQYGWNFTDFTSASVTSASAAANLVANTWNGAQYLAIKQGAWDALLEFYAD